MEEKIEPIFIFGSARGGTTLLRLMLNRHSQIAIPPESHFLLPVLAKYSTTALLKKSEITDILAIIEAHPRFRFWEIHKTLGVLAEQLKPPVTLFELVDAVFRLQIKATGKPRWGDKTPAYFVIIPELKKMFPKAKMIAYSRDGRDVVISLKKRGWHGWCLYQRANYWRECVDRIYDLKGDHNSFFLKYEELILDTENTLKALCTHLGIAFERQMLMYDQDYKKNITTDEQKIGIHTKLARKPTKDDKSRWKVESTYLEVWAFESVAYDALKKAGYKIVYYNPNNSMHRFGRMIYSFFGECVVLLYNIYGSSSSRWLKDKIKSLYMAYRQ